MAKSAADSVTAFVRATTRGDKNGELLVIPGWHQPDWETLFSFAQRLHVERGHVLIRKQASERALFFLASGLLEVVAVLGSHSLGAIAKIHPGSVVGELAFLDGMPRSAKVWAVNDSDLYRLDFADYERFAAAYPRQTCDLLFAIGRVVALRLRHSRTRVSQSS
jgi:CRP/FNR family transcriptional regulator, cyclic AMP receptor protein